MCCPTWCCRGLVAPHITRRCAFFLKQDGLTRLLALPPPNHRHCHDVVCKHHLRKVHPTRILLTQIRWNLSLPLHAVIQDHQYLVVPFAFPTLQGPTAISLKQILIVAPFLRLSWPSTPHPRDESLLRIRLVKALINLWVAPAQLHPVPSA